MLRYYIIIFQAENECPAIRTYITAVITFTNNLPTVHTAFYITSDEIVPENLYGISAVTLTEILVMTIDFSTIRDHFKFTVSFTDDIIKIHVITTLKGKAGSPRLMCLLSVFSYLLVDVLAVVLAERVLVLLAVAAVGIYTALYQLL